MKMKKTDEVKEYCCDGETINKSENYTALQACDSQSTEPVYEEYDDPGPETIFFVYKSMRIDDEWSIKLPRGFIWWGHQHLQHVWADDCRRDAGVDVTLMHVETDFLRNVRDSQQTYEALNELNSGASQFAFIYYSKQRSIRLHSTVYTHRQNLEWSKRLFMKAVGLQVSYAERMAESFSHLFTGSESDTSAHPSSGFRQENDEMVGLIDTFFIPLAEIEPPIESDIFKSAEKILQSQFMVTSGDNGLTAEFPFSGDEPACVRLTQGKPGVVTSLFMVNSVEGHPLLGRGLMMRMILPVSHGKERGLKTAMALNGLESTEWVRCHLNGAWYVDDRSNLVFISFFPVAGLRQGELENLAFSFALRSKWAGEVMAEVNHHRQTNGMVH